jgi:hypothetical protein
LLDCFHSRYELVYVDTVKLGLRLGSHHQVSFIGYIGYQLS